MKNCFDGTECPLMIESNHRIANHLAMLAGYVSLRRQEFSRLPGGQDGPDVLLLLDAIGAQVAAVSAMHRMLTTSESITSGDLGAHLGRICEALRQGPVGGTTIHYAKGAGCILPVSHILPVSQIVSEVITNALKYGQKVEGAGTIRVACTCGRDNRITISIKDDGDGILPDKAKVTKPNGIGFAMVAALVRQVNGTIEYKTSSTGLKFSLSLPSAVHAHAAQPISPRQYHHVSP
jgi:two-component sensor histidine kinase